MTNLGLNVLYNIWSCIKALIQSYKRKIQLL